MEKALLLGKTAPSRGLETALFSQKSVPNRGLETALLFQIHCPKQRSGNSTSLSNKTVLNSFGKNTCLGKKPSQTEVWKQHFFGFKRSICFSCLCLKAYNNICLVYTKFHALSYGYKFFVFLGGTIFAWFDAFFNTFGPSLTKIVYACFDGSSHQRTCLQITRQHRKIKKHVMLERSHATNGRFQQLFVFLQRQLFSAVQVSELISGNACSRPI